jgi:hypothetical protein
MNVYKSPEASRELRGVLMDEKVADTGSSKG